MDGWVVPRAVTQWIHCWHGPLVPLHGIDRHPFCAATYCLLSVLSTTPLSLQKGGWAHSSTIYQLTGHCLWCSSPSCPLDCPPPILFCCSALTSSTLEPCFWAMSAQTKHSCSSQEVHPAFDSPGLPWPGPGSLSFFLLRVDKQTFFYTHAAQTTRTISDPLRLLCTFCHLSSQCIMAGTRCLGLFQMFQLSQGERFGQTFQPMLFLFSLSWFLHPQNTVTRPAYPKKTTLNNNGVQDVLNWGG